MVAGVDIRCLQDKSLTGVGEYVWQTLQALHNLSPEMELIGYANATKPINLPPALKSKLQVERSYWPNKLKNLMFFSGLGRPIDTALASLKKSFNVLWLPNPGFVCLSGKYPVVLTVHDLSFIHFPEFFPRRGSFWYFPEVKRLLAKGLPANSLVAAVSQHTADDIAEIFPHLRSRLRVIKPGVSEEYFSEPVPEIKRAIKRKWNLPDRFLLSVGTIEPRKNYQLILQAYEQLIEQDKEYPLDLVIVGTWGWRTKSLEKLYNSLANRSRIHFLGYVEAGEKQAIYSLAEIFLYPSFYEGFGIPPLEAMASGVPVLTSHTSSLPEVVGEAGVLLDPRKVQTWVEAIKWLTNDSKAREDFTARGRQRARDFSWVTAAQAYRDVFNELS